MAEWINNDGLRIQIGVSEAEVTRSGEQAMNDGRRIFETVIDLANLGSSTALLEDTRTTVLPSGLRIDEIQVINETAATSGGSATLNLGLVRQDATTTYDADGFLAAAPLADFNLAGETLIYRIGTTGAGAFIGTTLANAGFLVADYDTAAFTAGRLLVRIIGHVPRPNASN